MTTDPPSRGGLELADAVRGLYKSGQSDYSLEPIILTDLAHHSIGRIKDGDTVIFCLRRGEREIQLTEAFTDPQVGDFPRAKFTHLPFIILTLYHEKFKDLPIAFAPTKIKHTLAEEISNAGLRQLHISESEKFAHVTFFLNGGNSNPFNNEIDIRIPSPKELPPELIPELSLPKVRDKVIDSIKDEYDFIVVNFANADVIGHTSNPDAKIKCAEVIDSNLGQVIEAALSSDFTILVTADHGNLEQMVNRDGSPNVSHTANPVPLILITRQNPPSATLKPGRLSDIAPVVLARLNLPKPPDMDGRDLFIGEGIDLSKKVLLIILDGWGIGKDDQTNPIYLAKTPNWDNLLKKYPHTHLSAAGEAVGLKSGKNGNSEAGHMNIGAGRVILQDDVRLDAAMQDGSFYENEIFISAMEDVKMRKSNLHLIGLLSEKSSHGSIDYPLALLKMAKNYGLPEVYIHLIFDGRSTEPGSAPDLLKNFNQKLNEIGLGKIVTGIGRGIALDRDGDYQKTQRAYDALVFAKGIKHPVDWS